jgi:SAM-dependent methyltransferase
MNHDPWLRRWLPLISARAGIEPILELGCGGGRDSAVLSAAGHRVVGVDVSEKAIANARAAVPSCEFFCQDIRAPFPVARTNVVLASLSLHYFPWDETQALVHRIRAALAPAGLLLCRLNATDDHHHGASGHPRLDENYYLVDGQPKRFFDQAAIEALFGAEWKVLHLEHRIVHRYEHPKALWELLAEPAA